MIGRATFLGILASIGSAAGVDAQAATNTHRSATTPIESVRREQPKPAGKQPERKPTEKRTPKKYLHDGKWLTKYEIERSKYERKNGQLRRKVEPKTQRERDAAARAKKVLDRKIRSEIRLLASSYGKTRAAAKKRLLKLADRHGRPELVKITNERFRVYDAYWRAQREAARRVAAPSTVTLGIRAEKSTLEGIDTVPVGFGRGGSGRIQLPRTRSVSVGTTAVVPVGR